MNFEEHIPLSEHTTFKIGGPARFFFRVRTMEEAREALGFARREKLPFFVLGGGSNLLASDEGFRGVIIKNEILGLSFTETGDEVEAAAGAGENWDAFVTETVKRGFYGLENLSGIPGTVGASPVQNVGAYGVEAKETIISVEALLGSTGESKIFNNAECRFAYRDSFFKTPEGKQYIITSVKFRLKKLGALNISYKDLKNYFAPQHGAPTLKSLRQAVLEIRRAKFPDLKITGTAGSFFKNPIISRQQFDELKKKFPDLPGFDQADESVKVSLAWILDHICNMKGLSRGKAALFERQPIVVVNTGGASAEKIQKLANEVVACVKKKTGINIVWEVEKL